MLVLNIIIKKTYIPVIIFPTGKSQSENEIREKILSAVNGLFKRSTVTSNILHD